MFCGLVTAATLARCFGESPVYLLLAMFVADASTRSISPSSASQHFLTYGFSETSRIFCTRLVEGCAQRQSALARRA
ncbi:MAG: hypothetical protein R3C56_34720 [Pirellulaceae bacterium]